jgi:hypothetical protein
MFLFTFFGVHGISFPWPPLLLECVLLGIMNKVDGQLSREQVMLLYDSDFSELIKH